MADFSYMDVLNTAQPALDVASTTGNDQISSFSSILNMTQKGAQIGGPLGAGIGAAGGVAMQAIGNTNRIKARKEAEKERKRRKEELKKERRESLRANRIDNSASIINQFPTEGVAGTPYYKKGGKIPPNVYNVEKGETVLHDPKSSPMTGDDELTTDVSAILSKIKGGTHEEGGVHASGGERVYSNKLKVSNELLKKLDDV